MSETFVVIMTILILFISYASLDGCQHENEVKAVDIGVAVIDESDNNPKYTVWGNYERENVIPDFKTNSSRMWTWNVVIVESGTDGPFAKLFLITPFDQPARYCDYIQ